MKFGVESFRYAAVSGHALGVSGRRRRLMATTTKTAARSTATRYIGIDVHCEFCEGGVIDSLGRESSQFHVATSIPTLLEVVEKVRRPRTVVIEEGPLADWLYRHLSPHVDQMIVC